MATLICFCYIYRFSFSLDYYYSLRFCVSVRRIASHVLNEATMIIVSVCVVWQMIDPFF